MNTSTNEKNDDNNAWHFAKPLSELQKSNALLARVAGKQIALFNTPNGVQACDNRCPHEGYPLSEGSVSPDCTLTCNWHNWKFNLKTGENLYGGDRLRVYPVELRGDEVWVDITDPPYQVRYAAITDSLRDAFDDHAYDRIAREIARLVQLGGDPLDAVRLSIQWSWQRIEFGWTHAYAGMADWLALYDEYSGDDEAQLVCLLESVAHTAFDVLREPEYPFTDKALAFNQAAFLQAIEQEDEPTAVALIRGGLRDGLQFDDFEHALTQAALAHYNDFGHALIYVTKAGDLIRRLGSDTAEPLLLSLVREFIFAAREDKIPEFRAYASALADWGKGAPENRVGEGGNTTLDARLWHQRGINKALDATVDNSGAPPEAIYRALLEANAVNLLSFDIAHQDKVHVTVSNNVGWLSFTHGITFANAVRKQCSRFPALWPQGLLQMACFSGRNAAFTTAEYDLDRWGCGDNEAAIQALLARVLDHGQDEYIVSVHWLKIVIAAREEIRELPAHQATLLVAALNRFINSPLKLKQVRRTVHQSLQFVAKG